MLRRQVSRLPQLREPSVAVLPLASGGTSIDDRDFAQGLGDELLDALARTRGLTVATRSSVYAIIERSRDPFVVGPTLDVATMLEGTVHRDGESVRIEARLSDSDSGATRWNKTYERDLVGLPTVSRDIAADIAAVLLGMRDAEAASATPGAAPNHAAYSSFVRGRRALHDSDSADRVLLATTLFREVVAADSTFARAQAGLCDAEVHQFLRTRDAQALERAGAPCQAALELEPDLPEAHMAMGRLQVARGEHAAALASYERATPDPALRADAYSGVARAYMDMHKDELALEYFAKARALQPSYWLTHFHIGHMRLIRRQYDEAVADFNLVLDLAPPDPWRARALTNLGICHLYSGRFELADGVLARSLALEPSYSALNMMGLLRYYQGAFTESVDLLARATQREPRDYRPRGNLGTALAASSGSQAAATVEFRRAAELAREYLSVRPDAVDTYASLAWYLVNVGEVDAARSTLATAASGARESPRAALKVAMAYARMGDDERAIEFAEIAVRRGFAPRLVYAEPVLQRFATAVPVRVPN